MLKYRIIERIGDKNIYEYIPEGNLRPGSLALYDSGKKEIITDSPDDIKGLYRGHAFCGIDITKDEGTVAWY